MRARFGPRRWPNIPKSGWDKVFDLNVRGLFFLIRDLVPMMEAAGAAEDPARIINIGVDRRLSHPQA